ncbi:MAG TPA: cupredoxin domain-containing protein [Gaiellaceae bacterium]|nr:cupredoxin domain-containing protein [Gaiellaceae bacterium]
MKRGVVIVAGCMLVLAAAGCGSSYNSSGGTTTEQSGGGGGGQRAIAGVQANDHGTKAVANSGKTQVELNDFYFKPTVLEGKAGEKVTLELKNQGNTEHSFTIDSQGIDKDLQPGGKAEVTVTIPKSGVVSFYCKFHKSSGMAGALAVTGQGGGSGGMTDTGTTTGKGYGY